MRFSRPLFVGLLAAIVIIAAPVPAAAKIGSEKALDKLKKGLDSVINNEQSMEKFLKKIDMTEPEFLAFVERLTEAHKNLKLKQSRLSDKDAKTIRQILRAAEQTHLKILQLKSRSGGPSLRRNNDSADSLSEDEGEAFEDELHNLPPEYRELYHRFRMRLLEED